MEIVEYFDRARILRFSPHRSGLEESGDGDGTSQKKIHEKDP
jgi:hypothetical protein